MLQKVTRLDSVPTAEETVLTTEVPTKESRLYTLLSRREPWSPMHWSVSYVIGLAILCNKPAYLALVYPNCLAITVCVWPASHIPIMCQRSYVTLPGIMHHDVF